MAQYSSLFQFLDAKLSWSSTIAIRSFLSNHPVIASVVSPVDEIISELRKKINQTKRDATNFDYLTYYKLNQNSFIVSLHITQDLFSYSEPEKKVIEQSKNLSNLNLQVTALDSDMVGEIDKFLPEEETKNTMDEKGKSALALTSKNLYGLFQPSRLFNALLSSVAHGNQDNAKNILTKYPELLMQSGTVTDYSGRTFENISAFQYALWALDTRYMCNMMLDCLPQNEKGEQIRLSLLEQRQKHKEQGVTYKLGDNTYQEKHYDFSPLTTALQEYADNCQHWGDNEATIHWCQKVGGAQRYVPAHVAQHYCDPDKSFCSTSFTQPEFKRTLNFYNYVTEELYSWFSPMPSASFGLNFGIARNDDAGFLIVLDDNTYRTWVGMRTQRPRQIAVQLDLAAVTTLCRERTDDLISLDRRLKSPFQKLEENLDTLFDDMVKQAP